MVLCIVLAVRPLPPYLHLECVHLMLFTWWMLPGLPRFSLVLRSRVLLWTQTEDQNEGGLGMRLDCITVYFLYMYWLSKDLGKWILSHLAHDATCMLVVCCKLYTFYMFAKSKVTAHKQFSAAGFAWLKHFRIQWYVGKNFGNRL